MLAAATFEYAACWQDDVAWERQAGTIATPKTPASLTETFKQVTNMFENFDDLWIILGYLGWISASFKASGFCL